jgi:Baseplate J-like protein
VTSAPVLDPRDETALLSELRAKSPSYLLTGWRPQPGGAGDGLLVVLARFANLVVQGLNAAPDKDFLAFLDAMGITLLTPRAARAPLVFALASAPTDVALPGGTEVAANLPPPLPSSLSAASGASSSQPAPPVFATDETISLARAGLTAVHSRIPATDSYVDHTAALSTGFTLFDPAMQQTTAHHLYLGHDTLFDLPAAPSVAVSIEVTPARQAPHGAGVQGVPMTWEYLTKEGWLTFQPVIDNTAGFVTEGNVALTKACGPALQKAAVNGVESFWIRAVASEALPQPGGSGSGPSLPLVSSIRAQVSYTTTDLPLDSASSNGFKVDPSKDFFPFGPQPLLGGTFLFACDEAFRRVGATMRIDLVLSKLGVGHADGAKNLVVKWEYGAGPGVWNEVPGLTADLTAQPSIAFPRPRDWQKVDVGGDSHYWLRARIAQGSYGGPVHYKVNAGDVTAEDVPDTPVIQKLTAGYTISTGGVAPNHCFTFNRFSFVDVTEACLWGRRPFQPFEAGDDPTPAVYLGFDKPLPVGLISLYADVPNPGEADSLSGASAYAWEYASPLGWSELAVHDETAGFQQSGVIQFIGPPDHESAAGPAAPVFWVRARQLAPSAEPAPQRLDSLFLNAVWATQRTSVLGEVVGRSDGAPRQVFFLRNAPVLGSESVEVEEWHGITREWQSLYQEVPPDLRRYDRDASGNVTGVWITWTEKHHLYSSGPRDRHYALERSSGLLRFGDGTLGMIPPPGAPISVSYDFTQGARGNVAGATISQLRSAVPYVQSVANPVPAGAGARPEDLGGARLRGPQHLRNRDRALSATDYEWLASEASAELARVRCLQEFGPNGPGQPGWVTMVIAPWSDNAQPKPSVALMREVRDYLAVRAPATVSKQVRVVVPSYVPVSVHAQVALVDASRAAEVEENLRKRLDTFLHPLQGGPRGTGWDFGEPVHLSHVAGVIEATPGVDYASQVQLTSGGAVFGDAVPIDSMSLATSGRHVLKLELES